MYAPEVTAILVTCLGVVAWYMIKEWKRTWENRVTAQDERLDNHDTKHSEHEVNHAVLSANLEHIRAAADETRTDVKELLRQNGQRDTG